MSVENPMVSELNVSDSPFKLPSFEDIPKRNQEFAIPNLTVNSSSDNGLLIYTIAYYGSTYLGNLVVYGGFAVGYFNLLMQFFGKDFTKILKNSFF